MTISEKLLTIADNTPAVAEVVNATKATVSGDNIFVDDVLDVVHPLEIHANEGTEVRVYGKNLFNQYAAQYSGAYCSSSIVDDALVVKTTSSGAYLSANFDIPNGDLLVGKTVTISGVWEASGANNGCLRLSWTNKDNKHGIAGDVVMTSTSGTPVTKTIGAKPANADKLALFIYGNFSGTGSTGATATYRNVQLEIGSLATDCQPYAEQVGIADADGCVKGLKSVTPTMTIVADAVAEVAYFPTSAADTYEKYQQLKAAEVALAESIKEE